MNPEPSTESTPEPAARRAHERAALASQFTAADVAAVLREHGWLQQSDGAAVGTGRAVDPLSPASATEQPGGGNESLEVWCGDVAALLGPHAADRAALAELLALVCDYDAPAILCSPETHAVLAREGAREVVRELAHLVLEGPEIDSDRLKAIVSALKQKLRFRGRDLFHPLRLALTGRTGEGELDRVILLLDRAARLPLAVRVKSARERIIELCTSME